MTWSTKSKFAFLLLSGMTIALAGCQGSSSSASNGAAASATPNYTVVAHGRPPVTYRRFVAGAKVKIVDTGEDGTANDTIMTIDGIAPGSVVTLNYATGVTINAQKTKVKGPLPRTHLYEFRQMN
jgi:hypothetical protein